MYVIDRHDQSRFIHGIESSPRKMKIPPDNNVSLVNFITTSISPSRLNQQLKTFAPEELRPNGQPPADRTGHATRSACCISCEFTLFPRSVLLLGRRLG